MIIERQAARFLVDIADAVSAIPSGTTSYGRFHVTEIVIGFDGDDTSLRVVEDEHGNLAITDSAPSELEDLRTRIAERLDRFVRDLPAQARATHPATAALDGIVNDADSNEAYDIALQLMLEGLAGATPEPAL